MIYIYIYIYIYNEYAHIIFRDFKDTVCPFFESDTLFLEHVFRAVFSCLAILRIEGCLNSTL